MDLSTHPLTTPSKFRWARDTRSTRAMAPWRNPGLLAGLAAAIVLIGGGFWLHHATEEALKEKLRQGLGTVTAASAEALTLWIENELRNAQDWSELPDVRGSAQRLAEVAAGNPHAAGELLAAPAHAELLETLQPLSESEDYDGFGLVGRDGMLLASSFDTQVGRRLSAQRMTLVARVLNGERVMTRPFQQGDMLAGAESILDEPRMYAVAPVRDAREEIIAAFYLIIRPEKDFTRILGIARLGESGDTYAFDRDGLMLSDSRHDRQLKAIGLIPDSPAARSILRVQLRDPGGDLTRGYQPDIPLAGRPLTRLVVAAVSGDVSAQVILTPYRDYRGISVVGAYHWLPKYGIGLATEVAVEAAFAAARPLRLMVFGLMGLLALSAVLIVIASLVVQFLRRRVEQVRQLGQYTLESKIGEGGMGEVYLARHALLRRPTAVKFIRAEQVSEESLERFEREVQSSSQLTHPNTIEIYDYGRDEAGIFYYVMEYLPGLTLAHLMELEGAIPSARVIYILRQLCASLAEAHARGFVHRDIKPLNIILTERGGRFDFVKVLDFGLVREINLPDAQHPGTVHEVAGTPPYIAPERLEDPSCMDARSDLYSVGVIAFNLLTGKQPFEGNSAMEIAWHCVNTQAASPADLTERSIPADLDRLIVECMARDLAQRPVSAESVIARLDAIPLDQCWNERAAQDWWKRNVARLEGAARELAERAVHV
jgi:hypothetical protein